MTTNSGSVAPREYLPDVGSNLFLQQMQNPSEVFSVLLIIGSDIIQKAIAQMSGKRITLISFSFGWVAYAFSSLMAAFGDGIFMPIPDYPALVINVKSGGRKTNESWLIGRLIRDLERMTTKPLKVWTEDERNEKGEVMTKLSGEQDSGLIVSFYETEPGGKSPTADLLEWSFGVVLLTQLAISIAPIVLHGNWSIMFLTAVGTILAIMTGSVREWRLEKYACRQKAKDPYIITRGNGHKFCFVIMSPNKDGLFLDDLAGAVHSAGPLTRITSALLTSLWLFFLITAGAVKQGTWYLLLIGAIGMAQNIVVAGVQRSTQSHGVPLRFTGIIRGLKKQGDRRPKVMQVLHEVEDYGYSIGTKGIGLALRREFFADYMLRASEVEEWRLKGEREIA